MNDLDLKQTIKGRYGDAATRVSAGTTDASCCGSSACCGSTTATWDPITANLYDEHEKAGLPAKAVLASLGCGNPTHSPSSNPVKLCSISVPAGASTFCCRRKEWGQRVRPMVSI